MTLLLFICGLVIGALGIIVYYRSKMGSAHTIAQEIIYRAEIEVREKEFALTEKSLKCTQEIEARSFAAKEKIEKSEGKLLERQEKLEERWSLIVKKLSEIEKKEGSLLAREKASLLLEERYLKDLESLASLNASEAKKMLLEKTEASLEKELSCLTHKYISLLQENIDKEAARLLVTAMGRLSLPCVSEASATTLPLQSEELKGRIIGREGRNIRALELACGVTLALDDTPMAIVISSFDPIRRHVAKTALLELMQDGRIHPTRIEEVTSLAKKTTEQSIKEYGLQAMHKAHLTSLHGELISLLGKLHFRSAFGQNVLLHSLEVSHLMGLLAEELHLNVPLARRIGLLHDIGKAVSEQTEGSHAIVGHDLALKYGESQEVANGIGCHHDEMPPTTIEAGLTSLADTLSAARPGAREEALEHHVKRLRKLETLAQSFPGVERAFALTAGKEVRVIVNPTTIDDIQMPLLAKKLAQKIEEDLAYSGRIKVTILRETKTVEYAV